MAMTMTMTICFGKEKVFNCVGLNSVVLLSLEGFCVNCIITPLRNTKIHNFICLANWLRKLPIKTVRKKMTETPTIERDHRMDFQVLICHKKDYKSIPRTTYCFWLCFLTLFETLHHFFSAYPTDWILNRKRKPTYHWEKLTRFQGIEFLKSLKVLASLHISVQVLCVWLCL